MNDLDGSKYRFVLFDLGGVLIQIHYYWEDAANHAGVQASFGPDGRTLIGAFPAMEAYQMGALDLAGYLGRLGDWSGVDAEQALLIHNAILIGEYPGVLELVEELREAGVLTGCLSNTNGRHWAELLRFPSVAQLDYRMASHEVGLSKPEKAIFHLFAQSNGLDPSQIVFFDDHPGNVAGAAEAGYRAFLVDPAGDPAAQMRATLVRLGVLPERRPSR